MELHEDVAAVQFQHQELGQALDLGRDLKVLELDERRLQHYAMRLRLADELKVQFESQESEEARQGIAALEAMGCVNRVAFDISHDHARARTSSPSCFCLIWFSFSFCATCG